MTSPPLFVSGTYFLPATILFLLSFSIDSFLHNVYLWQTYLTVPLIKTISSFLSHLHFEEVHALFHCVQSSPKGNSPRRYYYAKPDRNWSIFSLVRKETVRWVLIQDETRIKTICQTDSNNWLSFLPLVDWFR